MEKTDALKAVKFEITLEDLKIIQAELRELDFNWKSKLCWQMKEDEKIDAKSRAVISDVRIYNTFNGIVRNGSWKVLVYGQAKLLRDRLRKELMQVKEIV